MTVCLKSQARKPGKQQIPWNSYLGKDCLGLKGKGLMKPGNFQKLIRKR